MGKYDVLDKKYFADPERFSELISVGIFRRKVRVDKEDVELQELSYPSFRTTTGDYERDGLFLCEKHQVKYGLEVENHNDFGMSRRILVYDACEYEREALDIRKRHQEQKNLATFEERKSGMKRTDKLYPIVDVVLYLGMGRYKGQRSMREGFRTIPEDIKPYLQDKVQNYGFVLIEADFVHSEDFSSELRQFFEAMQARNDKEKMYRLFSREDFQNLSRETQQIIAVHLNQRYILEKVVEEKENMCKAMRDLEKQWKQEGREEGREKGILQSICAIMNTLNLTMNQAMDALNIEAEKREEYRKLLS